MSLGLLASYAAVATFAAAMIFSAVSDVLTMTIPDRLALALLLAFPVLAPLAGWPADKILFAVAAALVAFFCCVGAFALGWMGGGDGKLLTVSILWIGAEHSFDFLACTALVGGLFAVALLLFRRFVLPQAWTRAGWMLRLHHPDTGVPYAVAIGSAGLLVLPHTHWMKDLI